jgi:hypothetical protein
MHKGLSAPPRCLDGGDVDLLHLKGKGLAVPELRAAVETETGNTQNRELHRQYLALRQIVFFGFMFVCSLCSTEDTVRAVTCFASPGVKANAIREMFLTTPTVRSA